MKKFPKTLVALLVLALFVGLFSGVSYAAADLKEVRLTVDQLKVGYYNNTDLTGDIVSHCANSNVTKETNNLVDDKSYPFYWSKPYAFDDLKEIYGEQNPNANKVPVIWIDVANGGEGVSICGFEMQLREYLDCIPYSFEIQATTSASGSDWVSLFKDGNTAASWDGDWYHCEFEETVVHKVRILFYELGDADLFQDTAYGTLPSGSTRLSLAEINLLTKREATTAPTETPTEAPTVAPTQAPTAAPTEVSTAAPTDAPTEAPTQAPTTAPTDAPTEAPTQAPTQASTAVPTQVATQEPTQEPTAEETVPATQATAAPTEPATDATVPTHEATTVPTDGLITTVPATGPATQPENTDSVTNVGGADSPSDLTWIVIAGIAVAAVIAGVCVFFIIKKKRG